MPNPIVHFAWEVSATPQVKRGKVWWLVASLIGLLLFAYALTTTNFAFAVILIMIAIVLVLGNYRQHDARRIIVADSGIVIGQEVIIYHQINEFFVVEDVRRVYLTIRQFMAPCVDLFIPEDVDIQELRAVLRGYIKENTEQKEEPLSNILARKLKLF